MFKYHEAVRRADLLIVTVVAVVIGWLLLMGGEKGFVFAGGRELVFGIDAGHVDRAVRVVEKRLRSYGVKEFEVAAAGSGRFSVRLSTREDHDSEAIIALIQDLGLSEFRITVEPCAPNYEHYWEPFNAMLAAKGEMVRDVRPEDPAVDDIDNRRYPRGLRWYPLSEEARWEHPRVRLPERGEPWVPCVLDDYNVTGESLSSATYRRNTEGMGGDWLVVFDIKKFHQGNMVGLTRNKGDYMAIILNGEVDSAPVLE